MGHDTTQCVLPIGQIRMEIWLCEKGGIIKHYDTMTPNTRWNQSDIRRFASIGGEVTALKATSVILLMLGINNQESQEPQGKRPQGFLPASMAPTVIG